MIKARNIIKRYKSGDKEVTILKGINLDIKSGEFVAIIGRSGAGKSTLLYQLSLLDHPSEGEVEIDGAPVTKLNSKERTDFRLEHLGYIFQDYALVPELTAMENCIIPLIMRGFERKRAEEVAKIALERVGLITKMDNIPAKLSGGEQQRVSIARAIAIKPKILFADEPTANLDSENAEKIIDLFEELHLAGQTIVMVTHEEEYAKRTNRTIVLRDGEILEEIKNK